MSCSGNIPKGTIFKPSETTPDEYGYVIKRYDNQLYFCGNIANHHSDMPGTPFPCEFIEKVINEPWQIKSIKKKKKSSKKKKKKSSKKKSSKKK
jgi:hypothetical protein